VFAIACGYPDANDLDDLRQDPAFKLACGRLPETGVDLTSQPTMSRWDNAPDLRTLIPLSHSTRSLFDQASNQAASDPRIGDTGKSFSRISSSDPGVPPRNWARISSGSYSTPIEFVLKWGPFIYSLASSLVLNTST
jgi:hypothetical protein